MDDIQRVLEFLQNEISWFGEQKNSNDIFAKVYKEIDSDERIQLMKIIISAVQELQQYRSTGLTPHMVETLKENDKRSHRLAVQCAAELDDYWAIGTVKECQAAKEKQRPVPAIKNEVNTQVCPKCGYPIRWRFCPNCGQAIDMGK